MAYIRCLGMGDKVKASLYISKDTRERIRRSGLSLEEYFNRLYEMHERFSMDKWRDGYFYIEYFRVCLLRAETLNLILDHFDDNGLYKTGRKVGEELRFTIENGFKHYITSDDEIKVKLIDYFNQFSGWGQFTLENNLIIITMPLFTRPQFLQGYIEGIFNLQLSIIESHPNRIVFKITQ